MKNVLLFLLVSCFSSFSLQIPQYQNPSSFSDRDPLFQNNIPNENEFRPQFQNHMNPLSPERISPHVQNRMSPTLNPAFPGSIIPPSQNNRLMSPFQNQISPVGPDSMGPHGQNMMSPFFQDGISPTFQNNINPAFQASMNFLNQHKRSPNVQVA